MAVDAVGSSPAPQLSPAQQTKKSGLDTPSPLNLPPPAANDDPAVRLSLSDGAKQAAKPATYDSSGKTPAPETVSAPKNEPAVDSAESDPPQQAAQGTEESDAIG